MIFGNLTVIFASLFLWKQLTKQHKVMPLALNSSADETKKFQCYLMLCKFSLQEPEDHWCYNKHLSARENKGCTSSARREKLPHFWPGARRFLIFGFITPILRSDWLSTVQFIHKSHNFYALNRILFVANQNSIPGFQKWILNKYQYSGTPV